MCKSCVSVCVCVWASVFLAQPTGQHRVSLLPCPHVVQKHCSLPPGESRRLIGVTPPQWNVSQKEMGLNIAQYPQSELHYARHPHSRMDVHYYREHKNHSLSFTLLYVLHHSTKARDENNKPTVGKVSQTPMQLR